MKKRFSKKVISNIGEKRNKHLSQNVKGTRVNVAKNTVKVTLSITMGALFEDNTPYKRKQKPIILVRTSKRDKGDVTGR